MWLKYRENYERIPCPIERPPENIRKFYLFKVEKADNWILIVDWQLGIKAIISGFFIKFNTLISIKW
jgi:hypothetical protein